jgi:hypothetical protein
MEAPMRSSIYKVTHLCDADVSAEELRARWQKSAIDLIFDAIHKNEPLPEVFPKIPIEFCGRKCDIDDLRGIDLSGRKIFECDLSYCDLSFSLFSNSKLRGVHFQYSVISFADFKFADLVEIQASPVDAKGANFSSSRMRGCFFSHSNFDGAFFDRSEIVECDFAETNFGQAATFPGKKTEVQSQVRKKRPVTFGYYQYSVYDQVKKVVGPVKKATVTSSHTMDQRYIVAVVDGGGFKIKIHDDESASFFRTGDVVKVQKVISGRKKYGGAAMISKYRNSAGKKKRPHGSPSEWKIIGLEIDTSK